MEVARDTQVGLGSSEAGLYIGAGNNLEPGSFFSGLIDDIRRDVLDSSDVNRFSEAKYGKAKQDNETRILNILSDYEAYGTRVQDITAAATLSKTNYLLNSKGLNDVGWKVIARNYRRFITQIDPRGTSVGRWRVGPQNEPYSRYGRAFENSSGKNAMYFKLDDDFFSGPAGTVTIKIIYKNQPAGSKWDLIYDAGAGNFKKACTVNNTGNDTWKTITVKLTDAVMGHNGPKGADFALVNSDRLDDIFHMIEIERVVNGSS